MNYNKLTIEQKAKRYDKAIERANSLLSGNQLGNAWIYKLLPELRESEDERMRKEILSFLKEGKPYHCPNSAKRKEWAIWLEKQDEQNNNEDADILQRFSFYSYKDEPNILYLSGIYVNEDYRNKGIGTKILKVADEVAASMKCNSIRLKTEKDSRAEKLYRENGYTTILGEEENQIWLEKQGGITKLSEEEQNRFAKGVLSSCAMSFIDYLDAHKYEGKMCVSNGECEDIENAFHNAMWDRLHRYYCKYIEKQGEQETICDKCRKEQPSHSCQDITALGRCAVEHEQNPINKIEPKFKDGDWIVYKDTVWKVYNISLLNYYDLLKINNEVSTRTIEDVDESAHLWTVQDVKNGDVLVDEDNNIGLYREEKDDLYWESYIYLGCDGELRGFNIGGYHRNKNTEPATKKQRDTLFTKMKEAGFKWVAELVDKINV